MLSFCYSLRMRNFLLLSLLFLDQTGHTKEYDGETIVPLGFVGKMRKDLEYRPESAALFGAEYEYELIQSFISDKKNWDPIEALKKISPIRSSIVSNVSQAEPLAQDKFSAIQELQKALEKTAYAYPPPPAQELNVLLDAAKKKLAIARHNAISRFRTAVTIEKQAGEQVVSKVDSVIDSNNNIIIYSFLSKEAFLWPPEASAPIKLVPNSKEYAQAIDSFNREKEKQNNPHTSQL